MENYTFMGKDDKNKNPESVDETELNENEIFEQEAAEENVTDALTKLQDEFQQEKDRYLRLFAEFENFKKRTARERIELFKTAGEDVVQSLLPVLDDFGRALVQMKKSDDDGLYKGVELIYNKFKEVLRAKGLEQIDVNPGDPFDVEKHEAVSQIQAPDKKMKGKVLDVVEQGYSLGDKIIRYPKVVIGQ